MILSWSRTVYKLFELLAGKSAPHDFIQLITYKAATFSDEIEKVDTVRAYHASFLSRFLLPMGTITERLSLQSGPDYFVEIDIVMASETPLWKAHDIAQVLQDKIEVLPGVDRAFVHVDHETTHAPVSAFSDYANYQASTEVIAWSLGTPKTCLVAHSTHLLSPYFPSIFAHWTL